MGGHSKIDYTKVCWNCSGNLIEDKGVYVQCRSCGATWNDTPQPGVSAIIIEEEIIHDRAGKPIKTTRYRPNLRNK